MSNYQKNNTHKDIEVIDNDQRKLKKRKYDELQNKAVDSIVNKMPEIVDTISDIAVMYAETDNQIKLIETQGRHILQEAEGYIKKRKVEKDKIHAKGEVIINTLDKVNETLMNSNVPDGAKIAYAENLHKWITSIVEEVKND